MIVGSSLEIHLLCSQKVIGGHAIDMLVGNKQRIVKHVQENDAQLNPFGTQPSCLITRSPEKEGKMESEWADGNHFYDEGHRSK